MPFIFVQYKNLTGDLRFALLLRRNLLKRVGSGFFPSPMSCATNFIITHIIPIYAYIFLMSSIGGTLVHYNVCQLQEGRHHKLCIVVFYAASPGLLCV